MTKIGFIGAGNMAGAIVKGITESAFVPADDIYVYNINFEGAQKMAQRYGINACETLDTLIDQSDYIVLSIKPQVMATVLSDLKTMISGENKVLISIAAGITLEGISQHLTTDNVQGIIRVMPNLNVSTLTGASAIAGNQF
ncbi:MAG TPA: NAD(P)-binding domain-containing protein, partial [Candidatus Aquirickettsiella sp.]